MAVIRRILAFCSVLLFFTACSNPLADTINSAVLDANAPTLSMSPDSSTLCRDTSIYIYFSKSMDRNTLEISGLLTENCDAEWFINISDGSVSSQWLTISPRTEWPLLDNLDLTIRCSSIDGFTSFFKTYTYGVVGPDIHVDPDIGDDGNPGTANLPLKTIAEACSRTLDMNVNYAESYPISRIKARGGIYPEYSTATHQGIHLSGSWSSDWNSQDSVVHPSIIRPSFSGAEPLRDISPVFGILSNDYATQEGEIESFVIDVSNAPFHVSGLMVFDNSPRIRDVKIRLADSAEVTGFVVEGLGNPSLEDCHVEAENCGVFTGITLGTSTVDPIVISDTDIVSVNCTVSQGFQVVSSVAVLERCRVDISGTDKAQGGVFIGAHATIRNCLVESSGGTNGSTGFYVVNSDLVMENNTLIYSRWGIICESRSNPILLNNLFFQEGEGTYQDEAVYFAHSAESDPLVMENNYYSSRYVRNTASVNYDHTRIYLSADGDGVVSFVSNVNFPSFETLMDARFNWTYANNSISIADDSDAFTANWDLDSTAQSLPMRSPGLNLSSEFTDDIDGRARPAAGGWSVGAFQYTP